MFCASLLIWLSVVTCGVVCEMEEYDYYDTPGDLFIHDPLNVTQLDVINTKVNTIKRNAFSEYKHLKKLRLEGNIDHVEEGAFESLKSLREFSLNNNAIDYIDSRMFTGLDNLISLNLNRNKIDRVRLYSMESLLEISLSNNSLEELNDESFISLPRLKTLRLNFNSISTIALHTFSRCPSLARLHLDHNELITIENHLFYHLRNLQFLYLDHNYLTELNGNQFLGLQHLELLSISYNQIEDISSETFRDLKNLEHLVLSNNKIKVLHPNLLRNLNYLSGFWMDHNKLRNVPLKFFQDSRQLGVINFGNNLLNKFVISRNVQFSPSYVYLQHNQIATINWPPSVQQNIQLLDLSNNRMSNIDMESFKYLDHLLELNLSRNEIFEFPAHLPNSLIMLDLSSNRINSTSIAATTEIPRSLKSLDLSSNNIISKDVEHLLTKYPELDEINLDTNSITRMFKEDILSSDRHKFINVDRNWLVVCVPVAVVLIAVILGTGIFVTRKCIARKKKSMNVSWPGYVDVQRTVVNVIGEPGPSFVVRPAVLPRTSIASVDSNGYMITY